MGDLRSVTLAAVLAAVAPACALFDAAGAAADDDDDDVAFDAANAVEVCLDGDDNDGNGQTDCEDAACRDTADCSGGSPVELCNGTDDGVAPGYPPMPARVDESACACAADEGCDAIGAGFVCHTSVPSDTLPVGVGVCAPGCGTVDWCGAVRGVCDGSTDLCGEPATFCVPAGPCWEGPFKFGTSVEPGSVAVGDFDGDGRGDIVAGGQMGYDVWFGEPGGRFSLPMRVPTSEVRRVFVGSFLGGGSGVDLGVIRSNGPDELLEFHYISPTRQFQMHSETFPLLATSTAVTVADFESDGDDDVLVLLANLQAVLVTQSPASFGLMSPPTPIPTGVTGLAEVDTAALDAVFLVTSPVPGEVRRFRWDAAMGLVDEGLVGVSDEPRAAARFGTTVAVATECISGCAGVTTIRTFDAMPMEFAGAVPGHPFDPVGAASGNFGGVGDVGAVFASARGQGTMPPDLIMAVPGGNIGEIDHILLLDAGGVPTGVAAGKLNEDSIDDIVVALSADGAIGVLLSAPPE